MPTKIAKLQEQIKILKRQREHYKKRCIEVLEKNTDQLKELTRLRAEVSGVPDLMEEISALKRDIVDYEYQLGHTTAKLQKFTQSQDAYYSD